MSVVGSRIVAGMIAAGAIVGGCGGDPPGPAPADESPNLHSSLGIGASVAQYRRDEAAGVMQLKVVAGPETPPGNITSAQLRWDGFTPVPAVEVDTALSAGRRVDLPAPLGEAVCGPLDEVAPGESPPPPPLGDGVVRLTLSGSDGHQGRTVDAPLLSEAEAPLARVFQHACQRQTMDLAVHLEFAPRWRRADRAGTPTAVGSLVLSRGATVQPITVASVNGSVLLDLSLGGGDGGDSVDQAGPTLAAGSDTLAVGVHLTSSGRCDGHALGGSSQTYQLQAAVAVGDADPVGVTVTPDEDGRALLAQVIAEACG